MSPYAEPEYRALRVVLERGDVACVWRLPGCTGRATSPDHVPALAEHAHTPRGGCCVLVPACPPCNYARGAGVGNRRRRAWARSRLAPGSGRV